MTRECEGIATSEAIPIGRGIVTHHATRPLPQRELMRAARCRSPVSRGADTGAGSGEVPACPPSGVSPGDPDVVAAAAKGGALVPSAHTSTCQPDPTPTIETGVTAMTALAMSLWQ